MRPFHESTTSGKRLRQILGNEFDLHHFVNLIESFPGKSDSNNPRGDAWPRKKAKRQAANIQVMFRPEHFDGVVCVGRQVADAFGLLDIHPFFYWSVTRICVIPHVSGVVKFWNEKENIEKARRFLCSKHWR